LLTAADIRARLHAHASRGNAAILQRFFKTAPGEYGHGDVFMGVRVPALRLVCRQCRGVSLEQITRLIRSRIHEERLLALLLLVDAFTCADKASRVPAVDPRGVRGPSPSAAESGRRALYDFYLDHTRFINNWDLVDASAEHIVGAWLRERSRAPLVRLARSKDLWERRIAIIATFHFIKNREFDETFRIADLLLDDPEDLIHKAVGWMLREVGKRDPAAERAFLRPRYRAMPRTMLRYAIERFPEAERRRYLRGRV
jgi:3-methyladenine DNA glycosylase AlkD